MWLENHSLTMEGGDVDTSNEQAVARPFSDDEVKRLRRVMRAFPDDASADQAVELFEIYRSMGRVGRVLIGTLKLIAVVAAGVIAWMQLRGLWGGKGG